MAKRAGFHIPNLPPDRPKVPDVAPLIRQIYETYRGGAGCCLHVVTDGGNYDTSSVQWCLDNAEHDLCRRALEMLLQMTKTQRREASRLAHRAGSDAARSLTTAIAGAGSAQRAPRRKAQRSASPPASGTAMKDPNVTDPNIDARVQFECLHCKWVHRVPDENVFLDASVPRAIDIHEALAHDCGAPDVIERGSRYYDLHITRPVATARIKLL